MEAHSVWAAGAARRAPCCLQLIYLQLLSDITFMTYHTMGPFLAQRLLSMSAIAAFHLAFVLSIVSGSAYATCYFPDGSEAGRNFPCFPDRAVSFCCGVGWICSTNLLCLGSSIVPSEWNHVIRGSCTDGSWQSSACPRFCENSMWLACSIP